MENSLSHQQTWQSYCEQFASFSLMLAAFFLSFSTSLMIIFFSLANASFWLAGSLRSKFHYIFQHPLTYWSLAFFVLFIIGIIYSSATWSDIFYTFKQYMRLFLLPIMLPLFLSEKNVHRALNAFIIGSIVMVALSYLKIFGYFPYFHQPDPNTAFYDHINTSLIVAISSFVLIYKVTECKQWYDKLLILLIIALEISYLFIFNTGRSGLVLLIALFAIFLYQQLSTQKFLLGMLVFILAILGVFMISKNFSEIVVSAHQHTRAYMAHQQLTEPTSEGERLAFWKNSLYLFKNHPIIGTGTGSFKNEYGKIEGNILKTDNPHNQYLFFLVQFGVLGGVALIAWFTYLLHASQHIPKNLRYIIQGVVISFIIGCFFNSWIKDAVPGQILIFFLAMGYARLREKNTYDFN